MGRLRRTIAGLPRGKRTQLFRAVEEILRDDPALARVVKTWRSFEGEPGDLDPVVPDECPWVRLRLERRPIGWLPAESYMTVEVSVLIEVAVAGTCQDDLVDLWEAVEAALSVVSRYRGESIRDYLRHRAVTDPDGGTQGRGAYEFHFEEPAVSEARTVRQLDDGRQEVSAPWGLSGVGKFLMKTRKPA